MGLDQQEKRRNSKTRQIRRELSQFLRRELIRTKFSKIDSNLCATDATSSHSNKDNYVGLEEDEQWWQCIDNSNDHATQYSLLLRGMGVFEWQSEYGFPFTEYRGLCHLKPTHANVKNEVLYNSFCAIKSDNWNQALRKAKIWFQSFAKDQIKTTQSGVFDDRISGKHVTWNSGEVITLAEVVSLKLYTDFDALQRELKKCFYFTPHCSRESPQSLETRLSEFFHWRLSLLIILHKFGKAMDHSQCLYHGVDQKMVFSISGSKLFSGPLSTSSNVDIAATFASDNGMILKVSTMYPRLSLCRAFDASPISDFPLEQEWLVASMYLRVLHVQIKKLEFVKCNDCGISKNCFLSIHLLKAMCLSMSAHLEHCLCAFLSQLYNSSNDHELAIYIRKNKGIDIGDVRDCIEKRKCKIYKLLFRKFDEFRLTPNRRQIVKLDCVSDGLKKHFMCKSQRTDEWTISFRKIKRIFENAKEIRLLNSYRFDDVALEGLIDYIDYESKNKSENKLRKVQYLYYDYSDKQTTNNGIPVKWFAFKNPDELSANLMNELVRRGWTVCHSPKGSVGYQIVIESNSK